MRTNILTHEHARGQTDGPTDARTHTYASRMRACKHTNACNDERMHVRSNIWTHEYACGQTDRQTNGRTDGRANRYALKNLDARTCTRTDRQTTDGRREGLTHTPSRTRACTHTNAIMLTRTHDALRYIYPDG